MNEKEQASAAIVRARDELERALLELDKMPVLDPARIAFSAHALNNYLTVTKGTVELLLWSLDDHPNPQIRFWLQGLGHVTDLMHHAVTQLTASSSPTRARLMFMKLDLAVLVRRACDYYQRIAETKNITILFESPTDVASVWADPAAVAAVMDNLLSNAVKYSFPGKPIRVKVDSETETVICSVCDEGPGLSEDDQKRLFQRGIRLSAAPTAGESSNGYGLAVARELIDMLNGDLWCESTLGEGACFSFRLPVFAEQQET